MFLSAGVLWVLLSIDHRGRRGGLGGKTGRNLTTMKVVHWVNVSDCLHDHGTGPDLSCFSIYF